jgi:hypothetical protein
MSRFTNTLARVRIAAPCEAEWDEMRGDERVRFCQHCSLNVYNLSAMTKREAERLVTRNEGARLCVRFYRRKDGTMLTQPCPVGLRALKRRVSRLASGLFATLISFFAGVGVAPVQEKGPVEIAAERTASSSAKSEAIPSDAPAEAFAMAEGGMTIDPGPPLAASFGVLAGLSLLFVFPLMKYREWCAARRGHGLSIRRDS